MENIKLRYKIRLVSGALILAVLLALTAVPLTAKAAAPTVDLVIGGAGASAWNIDSLTPGATGSKAITISNSGSRSGDLTIWVSNIVNTGGSGGTEFEDGTGDLGDYLTFRLVSNRLATRVAMPALITSFPGSAEDNRYIKIPALGAGETITVTWEWHLPPATGNAVQGDKLSFVINYLLEETVPTPTITPGGGGGGAVITPTPTPTATATSTVTATETPTATATSTQPAGSLEVNWLNSVTWMQVTEDNRLVNDYTVNAMNGLATLAFSQGTQIQVTGTGEPQDTVKIVIAAHAEDLPASGQQAAVIETYRIAAVYNLSGERTSVSFDKPVAIYLKYDPEMIPAGATDIYIAYYNETTGEWTRLETPPGHTLVPGVAAGLINHLSLYAIIADFPPELPPAQFSISSLTVSPQSVQPGETVTITGRVSNTGGQTGNYSLDIFVTELEQTRREITLAAGQNLAYSLEVTPQHVGEYEVRFGDQLARFTVVASTDMILPLAITGAIALAIVLAIVIFIRLRRRRPREEEELF